jgi:uncharacterized protein YgiM (DUF1202 family)
MTRAYGKNNKGENQMNEKKILNEEHVPIEFQDVFENVEPVEQIEVTEPDEQIEIVEPVEKHEDVFGTVNCSLLNVRTEPKADAEILMTIEHGTKITISESESTEDFYKVYNSSGIEGFCMKEFIKIQ